jgi:Short C-terminal domain
MGLLRMAARTAVVAGTATAVSGRVQRRQQGRWAEQDQQEYEQQQYEQQQAAQAAAPPPAAAAPAANTDDVIAQLKQLGELRDAGVLTDEEFFAQKAKILG